MEATGRNLSELVPVKEQLKRDTLEKDFGHDGEDKVSFKEPVKQITASKDLDHDVEEKVPVEEQKQATTINTLEKDIAHGSDDDEVEKRKKATADFISKFQSTAEEYIGGGGDSFGANCWFD